MTPPHHKFKKNAPDWHEEIHERQRKAHSSRRIRVEPGIAHPKNWRALARHLGRHERMSDTVQGVVALEVAFGKVIGSLLRRHRAAEFRRFHAKLDKEFPDDLQVHLILHNHATHKTPDIRRWLLAHPRFHPHFTPTSASWLNLVERWFAELTQKKLERGVHRSVQASNTRPESGSPAGTSTHDRSSGRKPPTRALDKVAAYCQRISDSGHQVLCFRSGRYRLAPCCGCQLGKEK